MKIGDKVIVTKPISFNGNRYEIGHIFTIIGEDSIRGLDIRDNEGHTIYETRMISDHYKHYTIDIERDKKINTILKND